MVRDSVCTDPCESQKTEISKSANSQTPRIDSEKKQNEWYGPLLLGHLISVRLL
jgi:hypothetical protein